MGCDIHGWVEKKVSGKWIAYRELIDDARNYDRFAKLAGVRGDGPPAKGLPEDVSETTKLWSDHWDGDGHSHSWVDLIQAVEIFKETQFPNPGEYYNEYSAFGVEVNEPQELEGFRLVFWFDN